MAHKKSQPVVQSSLNHLKIVETRIKTLFENFTGMPKNDRLIAANNQIKEAIVNLSIINSQLLNK